MNTNPSRERITKMVKEFFKVDDEDEVLLQQIR